MRGVERDFMKKRTYLLICILGAVLLAGCGASSPQNISGSETKDSSEAISVSEGYYEHRTQNLRSVSNGTQTIAYGDRGVYIIDDAGWNCIYSETGIVGMDLYKDYIYIMVTPKDPEGSSQIVRMDMNGQNVTTVADISSSSFSLRIYNQVLYYYTTQESAYVMVGNPLNEDGTLGDAVDIENEDYIYKALNDFGKGVDDTYSVAYDPGYTSAYYNGVFEYQPKDEASKTLSFVNEKEELSLVSSLDKVLLVADTEIYYTDVTKGTECYKYDMKSESNTVFFDNGKNNQIINYDQDYLYITEDQMPAGGSATMIQRVNLRSGAVEDLFDIGLANLNVNTCFDICGNWFLYRDVNSGALVLQSKEDSTQVISEP